MTIPNAFSEEIFSLYTKIPAIRAIIGIVEIITELTVGELSVFNPIVSPMKYRNGSRNTRSKNQPQSFLSMRVTFPREKETMESTMAAKVILKNIREKTGNPCWRMELLHKKDTPHKNTAIETDIYTTDLLLIGIMIE